MSHHQSPPPGKDPALWATAQKRAGFKSHLMSYIIVNVFFWAIWLFTGKDYDDNDFFPWPVWPMLGWGIGIAFHYAEAYIFPKTNLVEKEYQKLKNKQ